MAVTPPPLFQPFRALGYITDDVPFAVQRRGKETFVTVSVGKAWQVREEKKRRLPPIKYQACTTFLFGSQPLRRSTTAAS
jgi:hypothetical protein